MMERRGPVHETVGAEGARGAVFEPRVFPVGHDPEYAAAARRAPKVHYGHLMRWLTLLAGACCPPSSSPPSESPIRRSSRPIPPTGGPRCTSCWCRSSPLLGVAQWILVRGLRDPLSWAVRVAAFLYVAFYSVVDAVAGIGAGTLVRHGMEAGAGHGMHGGGPALAALQLLFDVGNGVGRYGAWAFLLGSVLLAVVGLRRWGALALPGGLILIVGAYAFTVPTFTGRWVCCRC